MEFPVELQKLFDVSIVGHLVNQFIETVQLMLGDGGQGESKQ